jgi:phosphohistidine phosphatase
MRHAKSSWDDPELPDFDRPLNARGRKAANRMATYFRKAGISPELILCSAAKRTRETCEAILSAGIAPRVSFDDELYGAPAGDLLDLVRDLPDALMRVLIIGHNPGVQDLAQVITGQGDPTSIRRVHEGFPTGAMATLSCGPVWHDLNPGQARLVSFITPRDLEGRAPGS